MPSSPPAPERHFETIAQCARDGIITISPDLTVRYANPAVEEIFGYSPGELEGESLAGVLSEDHASDLEEWIEGFLDTGEEPVDWGDIRLQGRHSDGRTVPLSLSLTDFEQDGQRYFSGIVRDVTEQERREARLTGLNRLGQELNDAESTGEICDRTVDAARTILEHPIAAIGLYDDEGGRIEPCAWTPEVDEIADSGRLFATDRSVPWDVFVTQERRVVNDILAETDLEATDTQLRSAVFHPIGTYGVFVAGATETDAFHDDVDITSVLVGNAYSSMERVDREQALREQRNELAEKTESLDRLRRINDVIRELTTALTEATGRDEITTEVCTQLAESNPYQFAWFGSRDPTSGEVVPEAAAGGESGYLEAITVTDSDDEPASDPTGRAVRTQTVQIENEIYRNPPFEPWQQEAIQRGYRSSIAIPIIHQETLYGALTLYAAEEDVFDALEVSVLQELGETIAYALNTAERKQAFTSEQSVDLAFEIGEREGSVLAIADELGGRFELENLVERSDGSTTMFFAVRGPDSDAVVEWAKQRAQLHEIQLLADRDEEYLFECMLEESTVWSQLQQRGSVIREAVATPDSARIVIRIPRSADPRSFDALLEEAFGAVELVARRERDEPVMTPEEFEAEFRDRLTDRQDEVLQTAYYAGFFEWPRETQSGELADILGIAQPTVSRHIRSGEEKFLSMLYEDEDEDEDR
ncbi:MULTISPECIES: bacterio-opsin activator domain-containing protein [Natrialbaceae]|uniref:bacterio-opsin activator domain-containing protein n=1 Tax=Natrialbaceae TaxID=1644061 RepID=UPI00207CB877|nr:bacterio-opsin activator domain-containing protein [Natronococcus sp. CG52]